ncbi:MAG: hypothetical protein RMK57_15775 [Bryobacterales bacterium]|nr:hypothetical protein [Bryobacteraceae bacterium]MDW8355981.1 hypothetical protein [Bryobacterales bacterium]
MPAPRRSIVAVSLALFGLNFWIVRDLAWVEWLDQMGSIEGTHIALTRWVARHWGDLAWFPLWYGGVPFQNAYSPLVPLLGGALAACTELTPSRAYHLLAALFYAAGPVSLFWLALRLCGTLWPAAAAAVFYSLFSPSAWLVPAVRHDASSLWHPRRLQALVQYGEGPHVAALALIPVALLLLVAAWQRPGLVRSFVAAAALASVALTNWLGAAALAFGVGVWLLSERASDWRRWVAALAIAVWAYALACPWIPPSTVLTIRAGERWLSGELSPHRALFAAAVLAGVLGLRWLCRRCQTPQGLTFALLFAGPLSAVVLAAHWAGLRAVPQPERYHLEMEMSFALLLPFALRAGWRRLPARAGVSLGCVLGALCLYALVRYERHARSLIRPAAVEQTIEHRVARWLEAKLCPGRVMVPGSIGFFLNAFTDCPQLAGGFDQGAVNPLAAHVRYQILSGDGTGPREGEVAVAWLKAYGVDAVVVSGPSSREAYRPFRNPRKFEGLLRELWRADGVIVYDVGRRNRSLAHVIRPEDLPRRAPAHGADLDPVRPYVAALEDPGLPSAGFAWTSHHSAEITAETSPDQILSVQVSYHPGWRATVEGRPVPLKPDPLGQILIEPRCSGLCRVHLAYDGGMEMRVARGAAYLALGVGIAACLRAAFRRRVRG